VRHCARIAFFFSLISAAIAIPEDDVLSGPDDFLDFARRGTARTSCDSRVH
jgi:hypothetical protein